MQRRNPGEETQVALAEARVALVPLLSLLGVAEAQVSRTLALLAWWTDLLLISFFLKLRRDNVLLLPFFPPKYSVTSYSIF